VRLLPGRHRVFVEVLLGGGQCIAPWHAGLELVKALHNGSSGALVHFSEAEEEEFAPAMGLALDAVDAFSSAAVAFPDSQVEMTTHLVPFQLRRGTCRAVR
jgi:hypothetical protein